MNDQTRTDAAGSRRDEAGRPGPHGGLGPRPGGVKPPALAAMRLGRESLAAGAGRRPVDVICAGMYRACSTWQYEVVAHLVEHHRGGRRLGYLTAEEYARSGGRNHPPAGGRPDVGEGWSVFKSHDHDRRFARALASGRAVAIYAYRDVRDVVFSLMHKRRLTFEQLLRQGMIHQVLANDRFWTRRPHAIVQRYDAILADPVAAVRALADHLGIRPSAGEAERLASEYSLEANKARTEALRRQLEQHGVDLQGASGAQICDSSTLLHWNHVRDGRSGSWLAESTPRQRYVLRRLCGRWLEAHGYPAAPEGMDEEEPANPIGERIAIEVDILRGWMTYRMRQAAQRFPRVAKMARRVLGIAGPSEAGAVVWSGSRPDARGPGRGRR